MTETPRFRPARKPADGVGEVPWYDTTPSNARGMKTPKPYRLLMGWVHLAWFGMGWGVGALTMLLLDIAGFMG